MDGVAILGWARRRGMLTPVAAIVLLALLPLIPVLGTRGNLYWLSGALILGGLAIGFDYSAGYMGLVNFGYAGFSGSGAYVAGLFAATWNMSQPLSIIAGAVAGGIVGLAIGLLAVRFRGIYVSLVAWFVSMGLEVIASNLNSITGGAVGLPVPLLGGASGSASQYWMILTIVGVVLLVLRLSVSGKTGLMFRAIGDNSQAARSSGVSPMRYQVLNVVVSGVVAGLFGAIYGFYYAVVTPDLLDVSFVIPILIIVVIAGSGSLVAALLVAVPFGVLTQQFGNTANSLPGLGLAIFAALLLAFVVWYPSGIRGGVTAGWKFLQRQLESRVAARAGGESTGQPGFDQGKRPGDSLSAVAQRDVPEPAGQPRLKEPQE